MLRHFLFLVLIVYLPFSINAGEVVIPLSCKNIGNYDPKESNPWGQDNRSITNFPIVSKNENVISIHSEIPLENIQVIIKDKMNSVIYFNDITMMNNRSYSFSIEGLKDEEYIIEIVYETMLFYGVFLY